MEDYEIEYYSYMNGWDDDEDYNNLSSSEMEYEILMFDSTVLDEEDDFFDGENGEED
jgi:hypothetical protein